MMTGWTHVNDHYCHPDTDGKAVSNIILTLNDVSCTLDGNGTYAENESALATEVNLCKKPK